MPNVHEPIQKVSETYAWALQRGASEIFSDITRQRIVDLILNNMSDDDTDLFNFAALLQETID